LAVLSTAGSIGVQLGESHESSIFNGVVARRAAPKNVALVEWDSLDDAVAFYKSKAWTDLAPQRDKATKVVRRYVVEAEK